MGPIRILGIAPYQGIASLMDTVCADRENVEIDTFVGDMAAGLQIAQQRLADPGADYDVILSRGGTAELIRQNTDLPVIDIPLSVYDILRTIKLAENYEFSYAIIGFPAITRNAAFVCDVLRYTVEIHTIHDLAEARGVLARLRDKDCRLLLCDVVTTSLAQEYGIPTILFTSGLESVGEALDEAVQQALHQRQIRTQEDFFCQTLQALPHDTLVLRPDGTALVSAVHDPLPDAVHKRAAALALSARPQTCAVEAGRRLYDLTARPARRGEEPVQVVSITAREQAYPLEECGILFEDVQESADGFFSSFYRTTQTPAPGSLTLEQYLESRRPILIYGEPGTAKPQMARMLHGRSEWAGAPLVTVDCALLGERGWGYLLEQEASPLRQGGCALVFARVNLLDEAGLSRLLSAVSAFAARRRGLVLFLASGGALEALAPNFRRVIDALGCLTLRMPSLRDHLQDVPSLAGLYISSLNMRTARAIVGFEPEAARKMQQYPWPGNYDQFRRVLDELVLMTSSAYIPAASVDALLERERALYPGADGPKTPAAAPDGGPALPGAIALDQTLEQIELQVVKMVLAEEKGNQKRTAQRLGISRTTLWRMLQKDPQPAP